MLVDFAYLLKETFRESDVLGRLGGDEFAVLATQADASVLDGALQRLEHAVHAHNRDAGHEYDIEYSVGTLEFDRSRHEGIADLMAEADRLMYEHKSRKCADGDPRAAPPHEAVA